MLCRVFCLTGLIRLAVLCLPFKWIVPYLGEQGRESPHDAHQLELKLAQRLGRMVENIAPYTPWESKCLVQAITGKMLLRKAGIKNTLYLGVAKDKTGGMIAHAWLRVGPAIVTGRKGQAVFQVISFFGDVGDVKNDPSDDFG